MGQDDMPAICSVVLQVTTVNMRDAVCSNPVTMETIRPYNFSWASQQYVYFIFIFFSSHVSGPICCCGSDSCDIQYTH